MGGGNALVEKHNCGPHNIAILLLVTCSGFAEVSRRRNSMLGRHCGWHNLAFCCHNFTQDAASQASFHKPLLY